MDDVNQQTACECFTTTMLSNLLNLRHERGDLPLSDHPRGDVWEQASEEVFPAPEDVTKNKETWLQQLVAEDEEGWPPDKSTRCAHRQKNCATCGHGESEKCPHRQEKR